MATTTNTSTIRNYGTTPSTRTKTASSCGCPACRGLECMERPRFFAGQLLTEAELNSEQAYVIAKNRLHNRYLHGWGVVCGLEVVCSPCNGWVSVKEGYALDPCGNDIVVCRQTDFNILEQIQRCIDARRRTAEECPPWQDPNANCVDTEDHWCITIKYEETQARPTMPLRQEGTSSGCSSGCGCGGSGKKNASASKSGCSCGGGCGDAPAAPKTTARGVACEPTRILEQFRLEVVPQPAECRDAHQQTSSGTLTQISRADATRLAAGSIGTQVLRTLSPEFLNSKWVRLGAVESPDNSLFNQIFNIVDDVDQFLRQRLTVTELTSLSGLFNQLVVPQQGTERIISGFLPAGQPGTTTNEQFLYDLCCHFRQALADLYTQNPLNVRCAGFDCPPCVRPAVPAGPTGPTGSTGPKGATGATTTPLPIVDSGNKVTFTPVEGGVAPASSGPASLGLESARFDESVAATFSFGTPGTASGPVIDLTPLNCLMNALIDYIVDAVCMKLLPPCPSVPCDDRLILACVTISNGRIVHICNFACRHYAGSFNSLAYWTSAVPIVSAISSIVRQICCSPHALDGILGVRRRTIFDQSSTV